MRTELIDFQTELMRHEILFGREDIFEKIDRWIYQDQARWVLIVGGPGMGKSAILAHFLQRLKAQPPLAYVAFHFLRRGVADWAQPMVVIRSLSAQIEKLFPHLADPDAAAERRLNELLGRVATQVLIPEKKRLILMIDGIDEAEIESPKDALSRFLPPALPSCVSLICASRPTYTGLSWMEQHTPRRIDLDHPRWAASNTNACRAFWQHYGPLFSPPLTESFMLQAIERAQGNLLHAVKLSEYLEELPVDERRTDQIPYGLAGFFEQIMERFRSIPKEKRDLIKMGLGLLCAAREALPSTLLSEILGRVDEEFGESFLHEARWLLYEDSPLSSGPRRYRPFHESFREFVGAKLGRAGMQAMHHLLAEKLACWPPRRSEPFFLEYALRYALFHLAEAEDWLGIHRLATNVDFLTQRCRATGSTGLEADLALCVVRCPEEERRRLWGDIQGALRDESHWLHKSSEALPSLLYNRLCCLGWPISKIEGMLTWHFEGSVLRLQHPLPRAVHESERTIIGHMAPVQGCALTPDDQFVLSAGWDGLVRLWGLTSGREFAKFSGHDGAVNACALDPEGRIAVTASEDATLKVWDVPSSTELGTLRGHVGGVNACVITPDGSRVVSAGNDGTLRIWGLEDKKELGILLGHTDQVLACAVTPDGTRVVSSSWDRTLRVWDLSACSTVATLTGHRGPVFGCAVTPDGTRVVSSSWDRTMKIWDLTTGAELSSMIGHLDGIYGVALTPDGQRAISSSLDMTLKVWDLSTEREISTLVGHTFGVPACAATHDGKRVVSASFDRSLKVWALGPQRPSGTQFILDSGHSLPVCACAVSPDGSRAISGSLDRLIKVWDLNTGAELATLTGHAWSVVACAVSPDGRYFFSGSGDKTIKQWDFEQLVEVTTLRGHEDGVNVVEVSSDGQQIISGSLDRTLKVWNLAQRSEMYTLTGHQGPVLSCALTPNGRTIISGSFDCSIKLWDRHTGELLTTLNGHTGPVTGCRVTPNGKALVTASLDHTLKIWDIEAGREIRTLRGHHRGVRACAITMDGQRIISTSTDFTIKVWDLHTGNCIETVYGNTLFWCLDVEQDWVCAGDQGGNLWMLQYRQLRQGPPPTQTPEPTRNSIRAQLWATLRLDSDLDAFCMDYFPEVSRLFVDGMDRQRKLNILLEHHSPQEILDGLRRSR